MRPLLLPLSAAAVLFIPAYSNAETTATYTESNCSAASDTSSDSPLTLDRAWQLAESANPELRRAKVKISAVEGEMADANSLLWNNPTLSSGLVRRDVPQSNIDTVRQREWTLGFAQTFEIAGQQSYRRQSAQQQLNAVRASIQAIRSNVHAEVEQRYVQVLALQDRVSTECKSLKIIQNISDSVKKRVAAGEDSKLDGNLANVEAVRARNQINLLGEQLIQARADLAATLQLPDHKLPVVSGSLDTPIPGYTLETLLSSAPKRPLQRAIKYQEQAAQSQLALQRAMRYPDLTVGIGIGREGASTAREKLTTIGISLPIPLFRQNETGIGRAISELDQIQVEKETTTRNTTATIIALWQKLQSLKTRVDALQQEVIPSLEENQRLSVKSLQAGEISLFQLLLVNRQVLDGRRDLIDAQTELRLTRIALQLESGFSDEGEKQ